MLHEVVRYHFISFMSIDNSLVYGFGINTVGRIPVHRPVLHSDVLIHINDGI
jgi:hypothetical protein